MFIEAVQESAGYLSVLSYYLSLASVMSLLDEGACKRVDALRGRASFYTRQLLESQFAAPNADEESIDIE